MAGLLILTSILAFRRKFVWASCCFILSIPTLFAVGSLFIPHTDNLPSARTDPQYRLLHLNVFMQNHDTRSVVEMIRQHDPDFVCLVEIDTFWSDELLILRQQYPYQFDNPFSYGLGTRIFSKYPIDNYFAPNKPPQMKMGDMVVAKIQLPDSELNLVAVHTKSPVSRTRVLSLIHI